MTHPRFLELERREPLAADLVGDGLRVALGRDPPDGAVHEIPDVAGAVAREHVQRRRRLDNGAHLGCRLPKAVLRHDNLARRVGALPVLLDVEVFSTGGPALQRLCNYLETASAASCMRCIGSYQRELAVAVGRSTQGRSFHSDSVI